MDTIDLLETIGGDASLRYASADELQVVLGQAQASAEFAEAVALGESAPLRRELKIQQVTQVQQSNAPGHGDDEDENEGEDDEPAPSQPQR